MVVGAGIRNPISKAIIRIVYYFSPDSFILINNVLFSFRQKKVRVFKFYILYICINNKNKLISPIQHFTVF